MDNYGDFSVTAKIIIVWIVAVTFRVPQLLRHGASVYNGHFRGPVTLTFIAERLAVELSLPDFTT